MTTQLTLGGRYRILPNAQRAGAPGSCVSLYVGQEATLISPSDSDGGVMVRIEGNPVETYVLPEYLEPVTVVQPSTTKAADLAFGRLYTLTAEGVSRARTATTLSTITTTTPVVLLDAAADSDGDVRVAFDGASFGRQDLVPAYTKPEYLVPADSPDLAAFKRKVRDAVTVEAEERGWCDEVDEWLEKLGLEPRDAYPGLPRTRFAVVRLRGVYSGCTAVLSGPAEGDREWSIYREDGEFDRFVSHAFVYSRMDRVLFDGVGTD